LRRAVPSFTVEVRRRPRLATASNPDAQSSETKSPQVGFDRESHRPLAAAFEAKQVDPSPTVAASTRKGRILPSLVPDESLRRTFKTPHQHRQGLIHLRGRQSDRRGGRQSEGIKHPDRRGTWDSRRTKARRWLRECRPRHTKRPACHQIAGQAFRHGTRRVRQGKLSETPVDWR
jgi:hypothetical protein